MFASNAGLILAILVNGNVCVAVQVCVRLSSATVPVLAGKVAVKAAVADAGESVIAPLAPPELARVNVPLVEPPTPRVGVADAVMVFAVAEVSSVPAVVVVG
jgi:hypothetical protein